MRNIRPKKAQLKFFFIYVGFYMLDSIYLHMLDLTYVDGMILSINIKPGDPMCAPVKSVFNMRVSAKTASVKSALDKSASSKKVRLKQKCENFGR